MDNYEYLPLILEGSEVKVTLGVWEGGAGKGCIVDSCCAQLLIRRTERKKEKILILSHSSHRYSTVNHGYKSNGYKSKTLIRAEVLNQNQNRAFMK